MKAALIALVMLVSGAASAAPPFAGTIEMKISSTRGPGGTIKVTVGAPGALSEMTMTAPPGAPGGGGTFTMRTLTRKDKPDVVVLINDANKTYSEVPASANQPVMDEQWTVKKLGSEKVAGYPTTHVSATSSHGTVVELWTAKDVVDPVEFQRAMGNNGKLSNGLMDALKKEGADGFPAKMTTTTGDGVQITMELVKVTKSTPPASAFDLPVGYRKSEIPTAGIPPDVQRQMDEKMKNMTPEQKEALKKAMAGQR